MISRLKRNAGQAPSLLEEAQEAVAAAAGGLLAGLRLCPPLRIRRTRRPLRSLHPHPGEWPPRLGALPPSRRSRCGRPSLAGACAAAGTVQCACCRGVRGSAL